MVGYHEESIQVDVGHSQVRNSLVSWWINEQHARYTTTASFASVETQPCRTHCDPLL